MLQKQTGDVHVSALGGEEQSRCPGLQDERRYYHKYVIACRPERLCNNIAADPFISSILNIFFF